MRALPLILLLFLISCSTFSPTPQLQLPTQTSSPTLTPFADSDQASPTVEPLSISSFFPPTPVNTPHATPIVLTEMSVEKSIDLYNERLPHFEHTLKFEIESALVRSEAPKDQYYYVELQVTLTNTSNMPIVVAKELSYGWIVFHGVDFSVHLNGQSIDYQHCCVENPSYYSINDFATLLPNDFQRYSLGFLLPLVTHDSNGNEVRLANKAVTISAIYHNDKVGYGDKSQNYRYMDINAWVGRVESNAIEMVLP